MFLPSFTGDEADTVVSLDAGSYSVDEMADSGYTKTHSADCSGTILPGESKICTITNDDIKPTQCILEITKAVSSATANPGDILTYTINIANIGDADCTDSGVKIINTVDSQLEYLSETHSSNLEAGYKTEPLFDGTTLKWNANIRNPAETAEISW